MAFDLYLQRKNQHQDAGTLELVKQIGEATVAVHYVLPKKCLVDDPETKEIVLPAFVPGTPCIRDRKTNTVVAGTAAILLLKKLASEKVAAQEQKSTLPNQQPPPEAIRRQEEEAKARAEKQLDDFRRREEALAEQLEKERRIQQEQAVLQAQRRAEQRKRQAEARAAAALAAPSAVVVEIPERGEQKGESVPQIQVPPPEPPKPPQLPQLPEFDQHLVPVTKKHKYLLQDRPVLLEFWATWCGPCKKAIPHVISLYNAFGHAVTFVGVNSGESHDVIKQFSKDMKIPYSLAASNDLAARFAVRGIPHAILYDRRGKKRFSGHPTDDKLRLALVAVAAE